MPAWLTALAASKLMAVKEGSGDAVEAQTEASRKEGIWSAVKEADAVVLGRLLAANPSLVATRGPVGETILHMCYLYNTPEHKVIGETLLLKYPQLISLVYEGDTYLGENVLHIAVINKDTETARRFLDLDNGLVDGRAMGTFFQQGSACYYGETPLNFAACTNQRKMVHLLLDRGGDLNSRDGNGNTILHLLVLHGLPRMFDLIERLHRRSFGHRDDIIPLLDVVNNDGLSPLCLAARTGNSTMFSHILEKRKQVQWKYGPVSCCLLPLAELDLPAVPDGQGFDGVPRKSAIEEIVEHEHVDLLMLPRVLQLLNAKWSRFAGRLFMKRFIGFLLYLCVFLASSIGRSNLARNSREPSMYHFLHVPSEQASWLHWVPTVLGELIVFLGASYKGLLEIRELWQDGFRDHFSVSGAALLENVVSLGFGMCIWAAVVMSMAEMEETRAMMAFAAVLGWLYVLWFLLGFRITGPFVVMLFRMLMSDVLRFLFILAVFLMGFSQAFFVLLRDEGSVGFLLRVKMSFLAMLGGFDFADVAGSQFSTVSVGLLIVYVVVVSVLLLNLLVAMMGDTYTRINESAAQQWHLERARIIFSMENELSIAERLSPALRYWTTIDGAAYLQLEEVDQAFLADTGDLPDGESGVWTATDGASVGRSQQGGLFSPEDAAGDDDGAGAGAGDANPEPDAGDKGEGVGGAPASASNRVAGFLRAAIGRRRAKNRRSPSPFPGRGVRAQPEPEPEPEPEREPEPEPEPDFGAIAVRTRSARRRLNPR